MLFYCVSNSFFLEELNPKFKEDKAGVCVNFGQLSRDGQAGQGESLGTAKKERKWARPKDEYLIVSSSNYCNWKTLQEKKKVLTYIHFLSLNYRKK